MTEMVIKFALLLLLLEKGRIIKLLESRGIKRETVLQKQTGVKQGDYINLIF